MKLLIIGASRGTGLKATELALQQGHAVTALARSAAQISIEHANLRKVSGDYLQQAAVAAAVPGHDAVIITAALSMQGLKQNPHFFTQGTQLVIDAMKSAQVPRIIILSNFAAGDGLSKLNPVLKLMINLMMRGPVDDHTRQEQAAQRSGLQWSVVRPSRLTDTPATGGYKTGTERPILGAISRADVADFLVATATTSRGLNQITYLGN